MTNEEVFSKLKELQTMPENVSKAVTETLTDALQIGDSSAVFDQHSPAIAEYWIARQYAGAHNLLFQASIAMDSERIEQCINQLLGITHAMVRMGFPNAERYLFVADEFASHYNRLWAFVVEYADVLTAENVSDQMRNGATKQ